MADTNLRTYLEWRATISERNENQHNMIQNNKIQLLTATLPLLFLSCQSQTQQIELSGIFSDNMVMQRNQPISIWGWATNGTKITVSLDGQECQTVEATDGKFIATISAQQAGGPHTISVNTDTLHNIMFGDVYLCSGQSNMELPVRRVSEMFAAETDTTNNANVRFVTIPKEFAFGEEKENISPVKWQPLTPSTVQDFSALSYFMANELQHKTNIPIGIVCSAWGGTLIESWISEEAIKAYPSRYAEAQLYKDANYRKQIKATENQNYAHWNQILATNDPGLTSDIKWYSPSLNDSGWRTVNMFANVPYGRPADVERNMWGTDGCGPIAGSHWLRKHINIPAEMANQEAFIRLGCLVDADSVYVNGQFVGNTTYCYPPRNYRIPTNLLHEGDNVVTIYLISNGGVPQFVPDKPYRISTADGQHEVSLLGNWLYHVGSPMPSAPSSTFFCYKSTSLYNAMISPLRNLKFSGVVWYQGESNVGKHAVYADMMATLMNNWRQTFNQPQLPFFIVELSGFLHPTDGGQTAWALLRQAQAQATEADSNAYLVPNADLGEWNDIHPLDKKTLGHRVVESILSAN